MRAEAPRPSLVRGARLVIATHNPGKLTEIAALLAPHGLELLSAGGLGLPEPEETAESFAGNAALKAHAIAAGAGLPALADDSGLCVAALDGAPGIHSARWAGPRRNFSVAMKRVRDALQAREAEAGERDRRAAFVCALCLAWPDGHEACFEGRVEGSIVWPPRGTRGFGYDPIFLPEGRDQTFGEMDPAEKHAMSHRARAFAQFSQALLGAAP